MKTNDDILKELMEIAPKLAKLHKVNPYHLPQDYFLNFSTVLLQNLKLAEGQEELKAIAPELSGLKKQMQADLPSGYFTHFSSRVMEQIHLLESAEELKEIAPILSRLQKINAYPAPEGYFQTFPSQMQQQTLPRSTRSKSALSEWLGGMNTLLDKVMATIFKPRYTFAFAGSVAAVIMVWIMFIHVKPIQQQCPKDDLLCQLEKVSDADLEAYYYSHHDEFNKSVLDVSTDNSKLKSRNSRGELSLDQYLLNNVSEEELNNAILN